jgi:integrase
MNSLIIGDKPSHLNLFSLPRTRHRLETAIFAAIASILPPPHWVLKITTPHNLRDTAASLAIQAGASVVAVARLFGHESAATTLNHYAGLLPTDLDDVAVRLDAAARQAIAKQ